MKKVLHVLGTTNLGGAESRIMDLYRHMDRTKVQFDFLVHMDPVKYTQAIADGKEPEEYREPGHFDAEIESLGGHVYALPRFKGSNLAAYKKAAGRFFEAHHDYSVVQGHMTSTASIYLPIAKAAADQTSTDKTDEKIEKNNVLVTVAHTRNAGVDKGVKGLVTKILRGSLPKKADYLFACSHLAGDATFGTADYTYIPNTIDTVRFSFNPADRKMIRGRYGISDKAIVIGNVARFTLQKNQRYLIEAFAGLMKKGLNEEVYLIFCGDGPFIEDCKKRAEDLGIADKVIFAGNQSQVEKYYSAMDIFAFPSIYEGLPGVVVEAQASGLTCLISDKITGEVLITDVSENLDIDGPAEVWTGKLAKLCGRLKAGAAETADLRSKYSSQVRKAGFDVNDQAEKMMRFYMDPCDETLPSFE